MLKIQVPVHGKGQHIATFEVPTSAGLPQFFVDPSPTPKAWVRRHERIANTDLMVAEYWGESAALHGDVLSVVPATSDIPFLTSPYAPSDLDVLVVNDETLDPIPSGIRLLGTHALESRVTYRSAEYFGDASILLFARHPVVYVSLTVKRVATGPNRIPMRITFRMADSVPVQQEGQTLDCRCRFDFAVRKASKPADQESLNALANARSAPLYSRIVPVSP